MASLASTGPNCCATTRARSTSALVNACGCIAVDLDQRALAAADAHRHHQHGAVAEPHELGDLVGIALGIADHDLTGHVLVEQPPVAGKSVSCQRSPGLSLLSESSSSASSTTHISETSSAPSRRAAWRPALTSSSVLVTSARSSPSSASSRAQPAPLLIAVAATRTPWRTSAVAATSELSPAHASAGPRERVALRVGGVEVGQRGEVGEVLDALAADGGAGGAGERDQRLEQGVARRVAVGAVHERAVDLEDVRRDADHLLEPGVAGAGVVERDARAALAQLGQARLERLLGREQLVLGELDDHVGEVGGQDVGDRRRQQRAGADVERQERADGPARHRERGAQGERLELGAEAGAMGLGEPLVGTPHGLAVDAGERLVAADAAGGELEHRLEDHVHRVLAAAQQRLDLAALVGARGPGRQVGGVAAGLAAAGVLGGVEGGVGALEQLGGLWASSGYVATPAEDWSRIRPAWTSASAARARSAASAATSPATPGSTSTNSSPPSRPTASPARTTERSLAAAAASALSPSAWPSESLMRLKWSRSTTATLSGVPAAAAVSISRRSTSCEPRWLSSPVSPSVAAWWRRCSRWRAAS